MSRKTVTIEVPDDMTEKTARQCFLLGMRVYTESNNAGLCVTHGLERGNETALKLMSFRGEYAAAVMKFVTGVHYLEGSDVEGNLAIMRDKGSEMLKELEQKAKP